jgi:hypothetical protein
MTGIAPAPQRRKLNIDSVGAILLGRFDTSVDNVVATPIWKDDTFFLVAGVRDRDFIVICNATPGDRRKIVRWLSRHVPIHDCRTTEDAKACCARLWGGPSVTVH